MIKKKVDLPPKGDGSAFFSGDRVHRNLKPGANGGGRERHSEGIDEIERTKDRVGVGGLDDAERKELFRRFVAHGGKVLGEEDRKPRGEILRRAGQGGGKHAFGRRGSGAANRYTAPGVRVPLEGGEGPRQREPFPKSPVSVQDVARRTPPGTWPPAAAPPRFSLADRLRVQLTGYRHGVFTFGGRRLDVGFARSMRTEVRERLKELHLTVGSILNGEVSVINELLRASTGHNSALYEVLLRLNALYDEEEQGKLLGTFSSRSIPRRSSLPVLKGFFKKLYVLAEHHSVCRMCALKAVDIQGRGTGIRGDVLLSLKDQLSRNVDFLLGEVCMKLHLLLCKVARSYYPFYSRELDGFLELTKDDLLGSITEKLRRRRAEEAKRGAHGAFAHGVFADGALADGMHPNGAGADGGPGPSAAPPLQDGAPSGLDGGLSLVRRSIERYEEARRGDAVAGLPALDRRDKAYMGVLLLDIFDKEYSFILTTGKISFNIDYREQKKINVKGDLGYSYLLQSETWEEARDYLDIVREIVETASNLRLTPYQKFVMEKALERKRASAGRTVRRKITELMKTIEGTLDLVVSDYRSNGRLLQNPDEVLEFDRNVDGDKSVNGKKVIEAIMEARLFCATAQFLVQFGEPAGKPPVGEAPAGEVPAGETPEGDVPDDVLPLIDAPDDEGSRLSERYPSAEEASI